MERVCPRAHPKQGRVQACLVRQRASLSITCQEQLFRAEVDNAEDIRLQPKLFRDCLQDKKTVPLLSVCLPHVVPAHV